MYQLNVFSFWLLLLQMRKDTDSNMITLNLNLSKPRKRCDYLAELSALDSPIFLHLSIWIPEEQ